YAIGSGGQGGVQKGDVIVQVADARISCALEFERSLLDRRAGDRVPVIVQRGGEEKNVELVLASADRAAQPSGDVIWRKLGLRLTPTGGDAVTPGTQHPPRGLLV